MDPAAGRRAPVPAEEPTAPAGLRVADAAGRGRGVFAARPFAAGELIERAPVVVVPRADLRPLQGTLLDDYWFWWDEQHNALALGCGSLYNHACPANARFERDDAGRTLVIRAARAIAAGEEITLNYRGEPADAGPIWFAVR